MLKQLLILKLFYIILTESASIENDSTLISDLNLIANNLDKIPFSKLDIRLALNIDPCDGIKLEWNHKFKHIFGFQIVLYEYLKLNTKNVQFNLLQPVRLVSQNETLKTYTSNYIDSTISRFKLIYLHSKHDYEQMYRICLVVYLDINDGIQFEKHCINDFMVSKCTQESHNTNSEMLTNSTKPVDLTSCDQCKHYSNLLVAFVVSLVLLTINLIMFTIIIIQNTLKISLLKIKLNTYKQILSFRNLSNSANERIDQTEFDCTSQLFKDILKESCFDILKLLNIDSIVSKRDDASTSSKVSKKDSKKLNENNTTSYSIATRPSSSTQQIPTSTQITHLDSTSEKSNVMKYYLGGKKSVNTFHARPYFGFKTDLLQPPSQSVSTINILDSRHDIDEIFYNCHHNETKS